VKGLLGSILLAALTSVEAAAQNTSAEVATIDRALRYVVTSTKTKTPYQIDVLRVDSTAAPATEGYRMPVIYVLDGNSLFPLVAHMANVIGSFSRELPAVLVVSIGYPPDPSVSRAAALKERLAWRTRDLSPPATVAGSAPPGSGGAADFLSFIDDDLRPFIAARYPVNPDDQTLAGHSMAGLFTLYAFLDRPRMFSRYVAISPSIFWGNHAVLTQAGALAARTVTLPARLFVAVGGLETKERMSQDMIGDARNFVSIVERQKVAGIEIGFHVFPDENHVSVVPGALMRGLSQVGALR
jgi:predicted alpha/beta superfamily hydrolase